MTDHYAITAVRTRRKNRPESAFKEEDSIGEVALDARINLRNSSPVQTRMRHFRIFSGYTKHESILNIDYTCAFEQLVVYDLNNHYSVGEMNVEGWNYLQKIQSLEYFLTLCLQRDFQRIMRYRDLQSN